jgi:hypothetical protein
MYLGSVIDAALSSKKGKLLGINSPRYIATVLNQEFKKQAIPIKFKYETFEEYYKNDYSVGGIYDSNNDKCYIVLHFSTSRTFYLAGKDWDKFKFLISQACQHELIHKYQNQFRENTFDYEPIDLRSLHQEDLEDEQDYLSSLDEIDAYAHDIAMEIKYYYPFYNPLYVLTTISKRRKLDSFNYYRNTFKHEEWSYIRKLLLKKTYKWLPYVTYSRD